MTTIDDVKHAVQEYRKAVEHDHALLMRPDYGDYSTPVYQASTKHKELMAVVEKYVSSRMNAGAA